MKRLTLLLLLVASMGFAQTTDNLITDGKGREVLWGPFEFVDLTRPQFVDWYQKGYENYTPDTKTVKNLKETIGDYQIEVFMGTWCGDSKREVPRLIKLFGDLDMPKANVNFIAVRGDGAFYKQGPNGETLGRNIHRVPTIIISKNGQEVDRIVEDPIVSLEADLLAITQGNYQPQYPIANAVGSQFSNDKDRGLSDRKLKKLAVKFSDRTSSFYELNTLAYVLSTQNKEQQAVSVLKLNSLLFEDEAQVHYRLGKKLEALGAYNEAVDAYNKAISLKPEISDYSEALERVKSFKEGK
ncbi:tetratricopeptide repeat protein [Gilvibacter sp.]|uniref:tetratricopeptide repeat protein n=1 Tax=Gilvibacter sp. TaxID=2729997 RepID=UPI003F4A28CF